METLVGTPDPFRTYMGWYYRPSTDMYEFWWLGQEPMISIAGMMLEFMPTEIVMEIKASALVKTELTD